jgi:hypothetical protein
MFKRSLLALALFASALIGRASAQGQALPPGTSCNSPSGFVRVVGPVTISNAAIFAASTCGDITVVDGGPIPISTTSTAQGVANILASANNAGPQIRIYNAATADVNAYLAQFGTPAIYTGLSGTVLGTPSGAGVAAGAFQTVPNTAAAGCVAGNGQCTIFSIGSTGYANITATGTGNYAYSLFGRCDTNNANGSCVALELDCNNVVSDAPTTMPPALSPPVVGAPCIGLQSANIGAKRSLAAFRAVTIGQIGGPAPWWVDFYADPPLVAGTQYGVFIDATASFGPVNAGLFRSTGATPIMVSQVMGAAVPGNAIYEALDAAGNIIWRVNQSGAQIASSAFAGVLFNQLSNTDTGAGSSAVHLVSSNAGNMRIEADSVAAGSSGVLRWTGGGSTLIDALNVTGNIHLRTGAGALDAVVISSAQDTALFGSWSTSPMATKTVNYTVIANDTTLLFNGAGTITLTLPAAASYPGRWLYLRTIAAQSVVSNAANVVPIIGGAAGTAILAATAGKSAFLQSDGANWQIMLAN